MKLSKETLSEIGTIIFRYLIILFVIVSLVLGIFDSMIQLTISSRDPDVVVEKVVDSKRLYEIDTGTQSKENASLYGGIFLGVGGVNGQYTREDEMIYIWTQDTDRGRKTRCCNILDEECPGYETISEKETPHIDTIESTSTYYYKVLWFTREKTETETYQILYVPETAVDYDYHISARELVTQSSNEVRSKGES